MEIGSFLASPSSREEQPAKVKSTIIANPNGFIYLPPVPYFTRRPTKCFRLVTSRRYSFTSGRAMEIQERVDRTMSIPRLWTLDSALMTESEILQIFRDTSAPLEGHFI